VNGCAWKTPGQRPKTGPGRTASAIAERRQPKQSRPKQKPTLRNRFFVFRKKVERQDRRKEEIPRLANDRELQTRTARQRPGLQTGRLKHPKPCKTSASVEKRLHIHSIGCAKAAFLLTDPFLSTFGAAWIQCFSSASGST
jgi:hypothetical protein